MEDFTYHGNLVAVREWTCKGIALNPKVCYCCDEPIKDGEEVSLIINNYKNFSNVLLHSKCLVKWEGKTDELCEDIERDYIKYKNLSTIF